jgi:hypothetical protein
MFLSRCALLHALALALFAVASGRGAEAEPTGTLPAQFDLPRMKTSIYVGSVTLITGAFTLTEGAYTATYEAKVSPWSFWSEAGSIKLTVTPVDYDRLQRGETIEITGEARNGKGKLRQVTARTKATDATSGTIKVRIHASGTTLVFNSTYRILVAAAAGN